MACASLSSSTGTSLSCGGTTSGRPPAALRPPSCRFACGRTYAPAHPGTSSCRKRRTAVVYTGARAAVVPVKSSWLRMLMSRYAHLNVWYGRVYVCDVR